MISEGSDLDFEEKGIVLSEQLCLEWLPGTKKELRHIIKKI